MPIPNCLTKAVLIIGFSINSSKKGKKMKKITVLIVDDSALIRKIFTEILSEHPQIEVIGTASDPLEAREKIKQLNPDVLTLDIEMPKMDGISFLEKIMALRPMPVIMVSTLTQKGAEATIRALEIGAVDYLAKPVSNHNHDTLGALKDELTSKVINAASAHFRSKIIAQSSTIIKFTPPISGNKKIIAIGASTGGVEALRDLFVRLPANCPPIVITQHMPEHFTKSFAARLDNISQLRVEEASNHARLKDGHAYIAPGGLHLKILRLGADFVCKLEDSQSVSGHKPSVDVLFNSVAEAVGERAVGVILTGMGKDGAEGMLAMKKAGSYNIGQDEASCVVYGMPKVAYILGGVDIQAPLNKIAETMLRYCEKSGAK